jgi:hypothetical protein
VVFVIQMSNTWVRYDLYLFLVERVRGLTVPTSHQPLPLPLWCYNHTSATWDPRTELVTLSPTRLEGLTRIAT